MKEDFNIKDLEELLHEDDFNVYDEELPDDMVRETIDYFKGAVEEYGTTISKDAVDTLNSLLDQTNTITEKYLLELYNVYATFYNFVDSTFRQGKDFIVFAKPDNIEIIDSDFNAIQDTITRAIDELNKACNYLESNRFIELKELDDISTELLKDEPHDTVLFVKYKLIEKSEEELKHIHFLSNMFRGVLDDCMNDFISDKNKFIELFKQDRRMAFDVLEETRVKKQARKVNDTTLLNCLELIEELEDCKIYKHKTLGVKVIVNRYDSDVTKRYLRKVVKVK